MRSYHTTGRSASIAATVGAAIILAGTNEAFAGGGIAVYWDQMKTAAGAAARGAVITTLLPLGPLGDRMAPAATNAAGPTGEFANDSTANGARGVIGGVAAMAGAPASAMTGFAIVDTALSTAAFIAKPNYENALSLDLSAIGFLSGPVLERAPVLNFGLSAAGAYGAAVIWYLDSEKDRLDRLSYGPTSDVWKEQDRLLKKSWAISGNAVKDPDLKGFFRAGTQPQVSPQVVRIAPSAAEPQPSVPHTLSNAPEPQPGMTQAAVDALVPMYQSGNSASNSGSGVSVQLAPSGTPFFGTGGAGTDGSGATSTVTGGGGNAGPADAQPAQSTGQTSSAPGSIGPLYVDPKSLINASQGSPSFDIESVGDGGLGDNGQGEAQQPGDMISASQGESTGGAGLSQGSQSSGSAIAMLDPTAWIDNVIDGNSFVNRNGTFATMGTIAGIQLPGQGSSGGSGLSANQAVLLQQINTLGNQAIALGKDAMAHPGNAASDYIQVQAIQTRIQSLQNQLQGSGANVGTNSSASNNSAAGGSLVYGASQTCGLNGCTQSSASAGSSTKSPGSTITGTGTQANKIVAGSGGAQQASLGQTATAPSGSSTVNGGSTGANAGTNGSGGSTGTGSRTGSYNASPASSGSSGNAAPSGGTGSPSATSPSGSGNGSGSNGGSKNGVKFSKPSKLVSVSPTGGAIESSKSKTHALTTHMPIHPSTPHVRTVTPHIAIRTPTPRVNTPTVHVRIPTIRVPTIHIH